MYTLRAIIAVALVSTLCAHSALACSKSCSKTYPPMKAICSVEPNSAGTPENVMGTVTFTQATPNDDISIEVILEGFALSGDLHGFHVHQYGDIVGGCGSTGGHYNPKGVNHGGPTDTVRHPGDFGNLKQDAQGKVNITFTDPMASLFGDESIVGRGIVVHQNADDLGKGGNAGSLANGNAGPRLACCVIGIAPLD